MGIEPYEPTGKEVAWHVLQLLVPLSKVALDTFHPEQYQEICDKVKYCKAVLSSKLISDEPIEEEE